jgi:hypothetical protein
MTIAESAAHETPRGVAIRSGATSLHPNVTDRVLRMFEAIRASYPPRVTLARAVYFTESFQVTEASHSYCAGQRRSSTLPKMSL